MSISLDFTEMFAPNERCRDKENVVQTANHPSSDKTQFLTKMGGGIDDTPLYQGNEQENIERARLRDQVACMATDNDSLRYQILSLQREKERDRQIIESLRQEISASNTRVGSILVEQREMRNTWMQEKTELEGKMHQLQALQTQVQGTMRKKEKEFEKLQGHLQKQVKDSMRGQKVGVVMSKPVQKNSSQVKSAPGAYLLRDAELLAVNETVNILTTENNTLRSAIEKLGESTASLQTQFTSSIAQLTTKYQKEQEILLSKIQELQQLQLACHHSPSPSSKRDASAVDASPSETTPATASASPYRCKTIQESEASCILAASVKKRKIDEDLGSMTAATTTTDADESMSTMMLIVSSVASSDSAAATATTPCAKPAGWVADRVATGMKQLAVTMSESFLAGIENADCTTNNTNLHLMPPSAMKRSLYEDVGKLKRMTEEVDRLRAELACAMNQIHEQDKLIHQALVGHLPGLSLDIAMQVEEDANECYLNSTETVPASSMGSQVMQSPDNDMLDDLEAKFTMPPASPATKALLDSFGWDVPQRVDPQSAVKLRFST